MVGLAIVAVASKTALAKDADVSALQGYGADLSRTSVSGLSSGAFMASQFDVAYERYLGSKGFV